MINFESVEAKNFLSFGDKGMKINFKQGLNVISGENKDKNLRSNGTGKSSTIEPIYFALFGNTIREVKKQSDVVNWRYKKNAEVKLQFSKGKNKYEIIRCVKPSSLTLFKNGKNITRDSIKNTQGDIDTIIGCSEDVIKNCVIMGINQTIPFMQQGKAQKRQFIEGIFDMGIFFDMLKDVRKDYNEATKEMTSLEATIQEQERSLKIYKEQFERFDESKRERIQDIEDNIQESKERLDKLSKTSDNVKELNEKLEELNQESNDIDEKIEESEEKLSGKLSEKEQAYREEFRDEANTIKTLQNQIDSAFTEGTCPTCKREMSEDDSKHVEEEIQRLKLNIQTAENLKREAQKSLDKIDTVKEKINNSIRKLKSSKRDISSKKDDINKKIREASVNEQRINDLNDQIDRYNKSIDRIKEEKNEIKDKYEEQRDKLDINRKDFDKISKNVDVLDKLKFIFGENGVKSYIINKMLDILNNRINFYLHKLDGNCTLEFDEFFDVTITNEKKHECSYFNFSGGERRNIDVAIMFAFMDLQKAQGKFDCNLMCFDEIIDGSWDAEGVEAVINILMEKCDGTNKCIYLITHRKEADSYATGSVINVVKENGITKIAA